MFVFWLCSFLRLKWLLTFNSTDMLKTTCLCVPSEIKGYLKLDLFWALSLAVWCIATKASICIFCHSSHHSWSLIPLWSDYVLKTCTDKFRFLNHWLRSNTFFYHLSLQEEDISFSHVELLWRCRLPVTAENFVFSLWERYYKLKYFKWFGTCSKKKSI